MGAEAGLREGSGRAVQTVLKSEPRAVMGHASWAGTGRGEGEGAAGRGHPERRGGRRVPLRPATCEGPGEMGTGEDGSGEEAGCGQVRTEVKLPHLLDALLG